MALSASCSLTSASLPKCHYHLQFFVTLCIRVIFKTSVILMWFRSTNMNNLCSREHFFLVFTLKHLNVSRDWLCLTVCQPRRNISKTNSRSIKLLGLLQFLNIWSTSLDVGSAVHNFSSWPRLPHKFPLVWLSPKSFFFFLPSQSFKNWRFNFLLSQYDSILGIHRERNMLQCKKKTTPKNNRLWFCLTA